MSTGTNIERITENNGIINDNNADLVALKNRIDNLPDTSTATAQAKDIVQGKTAFVNGNQVTGTCDWQNIEWKPQPDWWDIKTIVENDTEDYPYKIIVLHNEQAKTQYWNWQYVSSTHLKKIKFSDGQEITSAQTVTIGDNGFKPCSKGYKTCYSIWYYSENPNFGYYDLGYWFKLAKYIYFYNVTDMIVNSRWNWYSVNQYYLEAIDSNKQIKYSTGNAGLGISTTTPLLIHRFPDLMYRYGGSVAPNMFTFKFLPFLSYNNALQIIQHRNVTLKSGTMPTIDGSFFGEHIDFERDWNMDTTLFTQTQNLGGPASIQKLNFENITSISGTFGVPILYEVYNIKITNNYFSSNRIDKDSLVRVLNALWDYSESEDTYTLTIGNDNLAKLTNEEKAIATNKRMDISIEYIL